MDTIGLTIKLPKLFYVAPKPCQIVMGRLKTGRVGALQNRPPSSLIYSGRWSILQGLIFGFWFFRTGLLFLIFKAIASPGDLHYF